MVMAIVTGVGGGGVLPMLPPPQQKSQRHPLRPFPLLINERLHAGRAPVGAVEWAGYLRSSSRGTQSPGARSYFQNNQPSTGYCVAASAAALGESYTLP